MQTADACRDVSLIGECILMTPDKSVASSNARQKDLIERPSPATRAFPHNGNGAAAKDEKTAHPLDMNSRTSGIPANATRIAIVGGGLGGLMTAFLLERRAPGQCDITIFEAGSRLGGKVVTRHFAKAPVPYEAGVAELYDYSQLGPDPLRALISEFDLSTRRIDGSAVIMDDRILTSDEELRRELGTAAFQAVRRFRSSARGAIAPAEYYELDWKADNRDRLHRQNFHQTLREISDESARRYIQILIHSDLATEPHLTNAMYGLQNYLMNEPEYMQLYTIEGGIERLPRALASRLKARVLLNSRVSRVEKTGDGAYQVISRRDGNNTSEEFNYVVAALPNNWLPLISWGGAALADAMHRHHVLYDYPAHYLRVSVLFARPFWRERIRDSYFMSDAFGGCCVYDESPRGREASHGVLGWLLAGDAALSMSNYDDEALVEAVLDTLPRALRQGRQLALEGRVHRWVGSVNGLPGGIATRDPDTCHQPDPDGHPELFVVGDYLFDSTINGVLDSADVVAEWIAEEISESDATTRPRSAGVLPVKAVAAAPARPAAPAGDARVSR